MYVKLAPKVLLHVTWLQIWHSGQSSHHRSRATPWRSRAHRVKLVGRTHARDYLITDPKELKQLLKTCYDINIDEDTDEVHPPDVCYVCVCQMKRIKKAQDSAFFKPVAAPFLWKAHTEAMCTVCQHYGTTFRRGRPKKNYGRPKGECVHNRGHLSGIRRSYCKWH